MASVTFDNVSKRYAGGVDAVRNVSFTIEDGELVTLVGPSGCGKSTLLGMVAGLESPTGGSVRIGDRDVTRLTPGERDVAMVFQSYALYPHRTVRGNLSFPLEVAKRPRNEIAERVEQTAASLEISHLLDRKPAQLSGGQRQRVALGRALVRRPKVFLFDEPLSNLDAALRTQMRGELKKLHESLRATFVYVTHDQAEAMTLSSRVVVLNRGEALQIAPPREVYARPANTFVASFFGSPPIQMLQPHTLGLPHRGVKIGIRPEHVRVDVDSARSADALRGEVVLVEPAGRETWVTVALSTDRIMGHADATFDAPLGSKVSVTVEREHVLLFDEASGIRIEG